MKLYVIAYATCSIDGRIADKKGWSKLSCPYDLRRLHRLRATCDAVIIGVNTAIVDDPRLTVRYVEGPNPLRVLIDPRLRAPLSLRMFRDGAAPTLVLTTKRAPQGKIEELSRMGVAVEVVGEEHVDLRLALNVLAERYSVRKALVEGGGRTHYKFLEAGLVDELRVTISPVALGAGVSLFEGEGFEGPRAPRFRLKSVMLCECGNEVHVIYEPLSD